MDSFELNRPCPPTTVYKYVIAERFDVLRDSRIRFTPPLNTNDIFEVRQTFKMLAGPKMQAMFSEQLAAIDIDQSIVDGLRGTPFEGMTSTAFKDMFASMVGQDAREVLLNSVTSMLDQRVFPLWNSPAAIDELLTNLGSNLICLSLTERFDSSPMWAHYAGNSSGFVIAFDATHEFFRRGDTGARQGLQKIAYFDGQIAELMDDPYSALVSKQLDWAYEREWRLYLKADQASQTIGTGDQTIHLVDFPKQAVQRVILGLRASPDLQSSLSGVLQRDYPHTALTRVLPDAATASLKEVPVPAAE